MKDKHIQSFNEHMWSKFKVNVITSNINESNSDDLLEIQIYLEEIAKYLKKGLSDINIISESPLVFEYTSNTISKDQAYLEKVRIDDNLLFTWIDVTPGVYTTAYYAPEELQFNNVQDALYFLNGRYRRPITGCYWNIGDLKRDRTPKRYYKTDKGDSWIDEIPNSWR